MRGGRILRVEVEPLNYASPQIRSRKWNILPLVPLIVGVVLIVWDLFWLMCGSLAAGGRMTPETTHDANLAGGLFLFGIYVGLIVAVSVGAAVAVRRRRYGPIAIACATLGIALCVLPFALSIYLGTIRWP
jgi:hypothetical protein